MAEGSAHGSPSKGVPPNKGSHLHTAPGMAEEPFCAASMQLPAQHTHQSTCFHPPINEEGALSHPEH